MSKVASERHLYRQNVNSVISKFTRKKKKSSWLIYVLHKTWNWEFSRRSRAETAKRCTIEINTCRVFFPNINVFLFRRSRCRRRRSDLKVPNVKSRPQSLFTWFLDSGLCPCYPLMLSILTSSILILYCCSCLGLRKWLFSYFSVLVLCLSFVIVTFHFYRTCEHSP